jgi:hypothetical protein
MIKNVIFDKKILLELISGILSKIPGIKFNNKMISNITYVDNKLNLTIVLNELNFNIFYVIFEMQKSVYNFIIKNFDILSTSVNLLIEYKAK